MPVWQAVSMESAKKAECRTENLRAESRCCGSGNPEKDRSPEICGSEKNAGPADSCLFFCQRKSSSTTFHAASMLLCSLM